MVPSKLRTRKKETYDNYLLSKVKGLLKIQDIICRLTVSNLLPLQPKLIVDLSFVHATQHELASMLPKFPHEIEIYYQLFF